MTDLAMGDILEGRYRIDARIARGGMSSVYRCTDLRLGRHVAAKVMDDRFAADPICVERFRREARVMAQLSHPNLVGVYDTSADGTSMFLIMELITGGTLRELLNERGPMPPHAAAAVMRAVLTGLAAAHAQGLIHRDLKPDNILINADGRVKLADFGLARAIAGATVSSDQIIGTVDYLSPEQVSGAKLTPQSDVYSAGVVLFELLTGTVPFDGDTNITKALARLDQDVPLPSERISGVPEQFDHLVTVACSQDMSYRYRDAEEFLEALNKAADELHLPEFTVPVPHNAAAHRAALAAGTAPAAATKVLNTPQKTTVIPPVAPPPPQPECEPHEELPPTVSNRSLVGTILWTLFIIVTVIMLLVGGWWFGSGRYGEVPVVQGMTKIQAADTIRTAGFTPDVAEVYSNDVPTNTIVGTQPQAGGELPRGGHVAVLVSKGKPTVPGLPDDHSFEAYEELLQDRTLKWVRGDSSFSHDAPSGGIAAVSPAPGTVVDAGSAVTLTISRGPAPVSVPDISGKTIREATLALEAIGLNVAGATTEKFDPHVKKGDVVTTDPGPSVRVAEGSDIQLVISNAVAVPDIYGMSKVEATKALERHNITVRHVFESAMNGKHRRSNEVLGSMPTPQTLIDPSKAEIDLIVSSQVLIPDVLGMTVGDAKDIIGDEGLVWQVDAGTSDKDYVWRQIPLPRTEGYRGEKVILKAD